MKKLILDFFRRGIVAAGVGPLVLAAFYLMVQQIHQIQSLTVREVCLGIVSLSALAFIAGGMNAVYQIDRLPLMAAVSIHGGVLYISYLITYLINGWLEWGTTPILVFTAIFVVGYLTIWIVIYSVIKRNTTKVNAVLNQKQQISEHTHP